MELTPAIGQMLINLGKRVKANPRFRAWAHMRECRRVTKEAIFVLNVGSAVRDAHVNQFAGF